MTREKIVEKIRKLLALAEGNPSAEEAGSALAAARLLMDAHAVQEGELEAVKSGAVAMETERMATVGGLSIEEISVLTSCAGVFDCKLTYSLVEVEGKRAIFLTGLKHDRETAEEAMQSVLRIMRAKERDFTFRMFGKSGRDRWFREGFAAAILEKASEIVRARMDPGGPGLVLVKLDLANRRLEADAPNCKTRDLTLSVRGLNGIAGYEAGNDAKIGVTREIGGRG